VKLTLAVSVAPGTSPRTDLVPLGPRFTYGGVQYPMAASAMTVDVPYATFKAAYDGKAISNDSNVAAADFDGNGDSYSQPALSAAGLARGAPVIVGATTLKWPDAAPGAADSVLAEGQTILMPASSPATQLTFLGASSTNGERGTSTTDDSGTGTIEYTDGTTQSYRLTLDDWFGPPDSTSNTVVATAAYVNDSRRAGKRGIPGRRNHKARVFAASIQLDPGKTISSVTLPKVATLPGVYPMHVFAMALGGASA
jgi:hypothetical protein